MATTFYTKEKVQGDLDLNRPDLIFSDPEDDFTPAEIWLKNMTEAFEKAGLKDGDTVFVTVAYSDGHFKPGNTRNMQNVVRYETHDGVKEVSLRGA